MFDFNEENGTGAEWLLQLLAVQARHFPRRTKADGSGPIESRGQLRSPFSSTCCADGGRRAPSMDSDADKEAPSALMGFAGEHKRHENGYYCR